MAHAPNTLLDLAPELLVNIFRLVPKTELANVLATCKTCHNLGTLVWKDHCTVTEEAWTGHPRALQEKAPSCWKQRLLERQWIVLANKFPTPSNELPPACATWFSTSRIFFNLVCLYSLNHSGPRLSTQVAHLACVLLANEFSLEYAEHQALEDADIPEIIFVCFQVALDLLHRGNHQGAQNFLMVYRRGFLSWMEHEFYPQVELLDATFPVRWSSLLDTFRRFDDYLVELDRQRTKTDLPISYKEEYMSYKMRCSKINLRIKRDGCKEWKRHMRNSIRVWAEVFMTKRELYFHTKSSIRHIRFVVDYVSFLAPPFPVPVVSAACVFLGRLFHANKEEEERCPRAGYVVGYSTFSHYKKLFFPEVPMHHLLEQEQEISTSYPCIPQEQVFLASEWILKHMDPSSVYMTVLNFRGIVETNEIWMDVDAMQLERVARELSAYISSNQDA